MEEPNWVCVYCGLEEPDTRDRTRDHVPPRNLFPEPRPSDLITVPCCRSCNESASMDDEFFRNIVTGRIESSGHPEAQRVFESVVRSFQRPEARGLTKRFLNNLLEGDMYTEGGVYVGQGVGYRFGETEGDRLDSVAARIVRGLYFHTFDIRLPDICTTKCYENSRLAANVDSINLEDLITIFRPMIERQPNVTLGNDVFEYWVERAEDDDFASACILRFYQSVLFFCFTTPSALNLSPARPENAGGGRETTGSG